MAIRWSSPTNAPNPPATNPKTADQLFFERPPCFKSSFPALVSSEVCWESGLATARPRQPQINMPRHQMMLCMSRCADLESWAAVFSPAGSNKEMTCMCSRQGEGWGLFECRVLSTSRQLERADLVDENLRRHREERHALAGGRQWKHEDRLGAAFWCVVPGGCPGAVARPLDQHASLKTEG